MAVVINDDDELSAMEVTNDIKDTITNIVDDIIDAENT